MKVNELQQHVATWMNLTNHNIEYKKPENKKYSLHLHVQINPPAMQETPIQFLSQEYLMEKG